VEFFGPKGHGMRVKEQGAECDDFEGGGGGVNVTTCAEKKGSSVEIESREWDFQVKEFIRKIH
ncbi:MAG: hypothetical protein HYU83_06190, partial [Chloroflexi bacterium]|nr:hypothetical protein [Chloroflexota bacterium]